ncbi:hypothetical protein ACA910_003757 [Epithemia clementina (nom. ined.)]
MADKMLDIPESASPMLRETWMHIPEQRKFLERMKYDQAKRGYEGYLERKAHRAATHKSWMQMKGFERVWYEITYPGHWPFVAGFAITSSFFFYLYYSNFTEENKAKSNYWQRFHAKHEDKKH